MSYGFEDDSALEELLNQQLDQRKQQSQQGLGSMPSIASGRPKTAATNLAVKSAQRGNAYTNPVLGSSMSVQRPATAITQSSTMSRQQQKDTFGRADDSAVQSDANQAKSKMASWLDGNRVTNSINKTAAVSEQIRRASKDQASTSSLFVSGAGQASGASLRALAAKQSLSKTRVNVENDDENNDDGDDDEEEEDLQQDRSFERFNESILREENLQEMSKQRLIQLILSQVLPTIQNLRRRRRQWRRRPSGDEYKLVAITTELEQLRSELHLEKSRAQSMSLRHSDEIQLIESRWLQVNKQLESRLELNERELNQTIERQKTQLDQLENENRRQLDKLAEGYQTKLADERQRFEETLKRREEFHQLELESKLKVNCELVKLETIFGEWDKMIKTTIGELSTQFKAVESLLDKQTIRVNGTNSDLARKANQLSEQYDKFERQGEQLSQLAEQMSKILPRFSQLQQDNETLGKKTAERLGDFLKRNDDLRAKESEIEKIKDELANDKEKLSEERFQLALGSNRLAYKDERLNELIQMNEEAGAKLAEQKRKQLEREGQLEELRASLEFKSNELKEQNYDLHLSRKKLIGKQDELAKLEAEVGVERKSLRKQLAQIREEARKFSELRERTQKEFSQLRRLQKSLVCSICLDRLFKGSEQTTTLVANTGNNIITDNRFLRSTVVNLADSDQLVASSKLLTRKEDEAAAAIGVPQLERRHFETELAKLSRYIELDAKKLEAENKYVELLSIGS